MFFLGGYPKTRAISLVALCTSLLSISSMISIPIPFSPVPVTLQVLMVYVLSAMLGPIYGAASCMIYLLLGTIGLPVFAGASSGISILLGPTGGYLMSFPFAVFAGGWICVRRSLAKRAEAMKLCIAFAVELFVIYAIGVAWLSHSTGMTLYQAVLLGALPFLPIDACKAAIALPIALRIRQIHARLPIGITKNVERTD